MQGRVLVPRHAPPRTGSRRGAPYCADMTTWIVSGGVSPRGLAGKPLAGFRATPSRRIPSFCSKHRVVGMVAGSALCVGHDPCGSASSTEPLPVHLLDGPTADLQALGQFPLAHSLRPLHLDVLPLLLAQAGLRPGKRPSARAFAWPATERSLIELRHHSLRRAPSRAGACRWTWPCRSPPPGTGTPLPPGAGPRSPAARRSAPGRAGQCG